MEKQTVSWTKEFEQNLAAATSRFFVLHSNIRDFVPIADDFINLKDYLTEKLTSGEEGYLVIFYNIGSGFHFLDDDEEHYFRILAELPVKAHRLSREEQKRREELLKIGAALMEFELPIDPAKALPLIEKAMLSRHRRKIAVVIEYGDSMIATENSNFSDRALTVTLERWADDSLFDDRGHVVILIADDLNSLPSNLRQSNIEATDIPLPSAEERLVFVQKKISAEYDFKMPEHQLANLTAGLNRKQIGYICQKSSSENEELDPQRIKDYKKHIIEQEYAGLIEVVEPRFGFEAIGGLEYVKDFFRNIILAVEMGETRLVPMGTTIMGPPGTGKTAVVEAAAFESGFNYLKIINPRDSFVGESEKRYWRALQVIKANAPVVVLEDEADQSEQSRDEWTGDSGVSNRLRQMRFDFTSDPGIRGKVLWIRITNRPDKMDMADMRAGRSSIRFAMVMPDETEKVGIFKVMPIKHNFQFMSNIDFDKVVKAMTHKHKECISGADIEEISLRAFTNCRLRREHKVTEQDLLWAVNDYRPLNRPEDIKFQEEQALKFCSSLELMPPKYRSK